MSESKRNGAPDKTVRARLAKPQKSEGRQNYDDEQYDMDNRFIRVISFARGSCPVARIVVNRQMVARPWEIG